MSDVVEDSIVVAADLDTVMDVVSDFVAYPEWQDEVREVEVLETDEHGWGTRVRFVVDARVFSTAYVLAYDYEDAAMSWHLVEGDAIERLQGSYQLRDVGDGRTDVRYRLEVVPAVPLPGIVRRQAARRIVDGALRGMKRRAESLA